jgi:hypothetical protein
MLDGGEDAPLSRRGRVLFFGAIIIVVVVGGTLIAFARP